MLRSLKKASIAEGVVTQQEFDWLCAHMGTFDCSNNSLSGSIPTLHLTRMPRLVLLYLHGNKVARGRRPGARPPAAFYSTEF